MGGRFIKHSPINREIPILRYELSGNYNGKIYNVSARSQIKIQVITNKYKIRYKLIKLEV